MNDNKPKVLVLLAAYNGREWLDEQIMSILNQQDVDIELVVSVDASSDGTEQYFEKLELEDSRVTLLPTGEKFGGAAPNFFRLIRDADFTNIDFISLADQDDIWYLDKLSRACTCLKEGVYDAYSSNVVAFWPNGKKALVDKAQRQTKYDYLFECSGPGCTFVLDIKLAAEIKSKIVRSYNKINTVWMHDWFCYNYSRFHGFKWYIDEKPSLLYRQHEENSVGANSGMRALITRVKVILNGDGFERVLNKAHFIGETNLYPIKLITKRSRLSFLKLACMSFSCRRKFHDKLFFFCVCIAFSIKGLH